MSAIAKESMNLALEGCLVKLNAWPPLVQNQEAQAPANQTIVFATAQRIKVQDTQEVLERIA